MAKTIDIPEILENTNTNLGPILADAKFCQTFIPKRNHLTAIYLWVATYCKQIKTEVTLQIRDAKTHNLLREVFLKTDNFKDNHWQKFAFAPIETSLNSALEFCFTSSSLHPESAITLWTNNTIAGCYKNANLLAESICYYGEYLEKYLKPEVENHIKQQLTNYFIDKKFWGNVDELVSALMSVNQYAVRFESLLKIAPISSFSPLSKILLSGMAVGSEMVTAKNYGFGEVYGVEVEPYYVKLCQQRFAHLETMYPTLYDGLTLPYPDNFFEVIISGHIIEHTANPCQYLHENLRVLKPGGYLFLEYPTRYNSTELHTGLPSWEWLPMPLRWLTLKLLSSKLLPLENSQKYRYQTILATALKPISLWQIKTWLHQSPHHPKLLSLSKPLPGIIRCIFQK